VIPGSFSGEGGKNPDHVTSIVRVRSISETDLLAFCLFESWLKCISQNQSQNHL